MRLTVLAVALLIVACDPPPVENEASNQQPPTQNKAVQAPPRTENKSTQPQGPVTRDEAIQLANEYLVNRMGGDLIGLVPRAEERADNWIVGYDFDPPNVGGAPTFAVDKRTREVRVISLSQ